MEEQTKVNERIRVRKMKFEFPDDIAALWNPHKPEWSHIVNAASLTMPYLEPYLIRVIKRALGSIRDGRLKEDALAFIAQEGQHYRQHRRFNELLIAKGYHGLRGIEASLEGDYAGWEATRSLEWNLAYAAGFESGAAGIGHWLIKDRDYLFGGSESSVASMVLWHFVEELEHKEVAVALFRHLCGDEALRVYGIWFAIGHLLFRIRSAYKVLLVQDGLWEDPKSRWRLQKMILRAHRALLPSVLRASLPGHDPASISDPQWAADWKIFYDKGDNRVARLDTNHLAASPR